LISSVRNWSNSPGVSTAVNVMDVGQVEREGLRAKIDRMKVDTSVFIVGAAQGSANLKKEEPGETHR
jgi:hypothetical protein